MHLVYLNLISNNPKFRLGCACTHDKAICLLDFKIMYCHSIINHIKYNFLMLIWIFFILCQEMKVCKTKIKYLKNQKKFNWRQISDNKYIVWHFIYSSLRLLCIVCLGTFYLIYIKIRTNRSSKNVNRKKNYVILFYLIKYDSKSALLTIGNFCAAKNIIRQVNNFIS